MNIFTWTDILCSLNGDKDIPYFNKKTGISIGSFDGLHKGHRILLNKLIEECKNNKLNSGVLTFKRPLPSIKHKENYSGDISTLNQRLKLFEQMGIDFVILVDFDESFSSMLGADFLNILINVCNMDLLAEGIDFKCGFKGATDIQAIKYFVEKNKIKSVFVNPVYFKEGTDEEERISSSFIRQMIQKGFFTTVNELLERPYEIEISKTKITQVLPPDGIYHCKCNDDVEIRVEILQGQIYIKENSLKNDDLCISFI